MNFYIKHVDGIGSSNEVIWKDLKTVRGVKNRIINGYFKKGKWSVYTFTKVFDESTYHKVSTFVK